MALRWLRGPVSLRVQLALAFAAAVAAALVIFGAVVTGVVWRAEALEEAAKASARRENQERREHDRSHHRHHAHHRPPDDAAMGEPPAEAPMGEPTDEHERERDAFEEVELGDYDDDHDVERVLQAMLAAAPLVIAAAAAFGLWLSRRALLPLRDASARAQAARASSLQLTLPVRGANDEWDDLATTLNQLLADARGSLARIQRFTADAAHELRTPLTTLIGEADLALRRERPAADLRASLTVVRAESQRMAQLVDALLSLSRADAGTLLSQTHPDPVELEPLLREAAARAEARAERSHKPFAVALSFGETGPHLARGEPVLLARALGNLLDNAVDHGGTRVELSVRDEGDSLRIRVEDNGPGIAPSLRARLFERFARADVSRQSDGSGDGFGLGLALSRAIAQAHGGSLELLREGPGAAFDLRLLRA